MQLLARDSTESGQHLGLGLIDAVVRPLGSPTAIGLGEANAAAYRLELRQEVIHVCSRVFRPQAISISCTVIMRSRRQ